MFKYVKQACLSLILVSCGAQNDLPEASQPTSDESLVNAQASERKGRMCHRIRYKIKLHIVDDDIGRDDVGNYKKSGRFVLCQSNKDDDIGSSVEHIRFIKKHGNEMRAELFLVAYYNIYHNNDVVFQGDLKMYEGWSTDTRDLDGRKYFAAALDKDEKYDKKVLRGTIKSREFNDDSRIRYRIELRSKRVK